MAARGREQDAGDIQGVQDLDRPVPQAGGLEKLDVQAGAMADGLAAAEEFAQIAEGVLRPGRPPQVLLLDAGKAEDGVGDGAARVDQLLQCRGDLIRGEGDGADLDDSVSGRIQTGRL